jgi:hypothetical protein
MPSIFGMRLLGGRFSRHDGVGLGVQLRVISGPVAPVKISAANIFMRQRYTIDIGPAGWSGRRLPENWCRIAASGCWAQAVTNLNGVTMQFSP